LSAPHELYPLKSISFETVAIKGLMLSSRMMSWTYFLRGASARR
jgi:hypothetical protein